MGFEGGASVFQSECVGKRRPCRSNSMIEGRLTRVCPVSREWAFQTLGDGVERWRIILERWCGPDYEGSVCYVDGSSFITQPWRVFKYRASWSHWRGEAGLGDGKNRGSGAKLPGSKSWLCHLFPIWLWGKYLTSLCLCSFICKMELILTALIVLRGLLWLNKSMQSTYKSAQLPLTAQ